MAAKAQNERLLRRTTNGKKKRKVPLRIPPLTLSLSKGWRGWPALAGRGWTMVAGGCWAYFLQSTFTPLVLSLSKPALSLSKGGRVVRRCTHIKLNLLLTVI
jgi:hypothetical protein